jgi:AcrR family transcriptional regulator
MSTTTPGRPRNPQGTGGRLRDELIAAAARLLDRTGDEEALTLRAVAREAGVAAPSVYLHFASKDALIRAVVAAHFAELRQAIVAAAATEDEPATRLRTACLAYCRFGLERPGAYRVLFQTPRRIESDQPPDQFTYVGREAFATLVDGIAACMAAGVAPPGDPTRVATTVWAGLHGIVSLRQTLPRFPSWPPVAAMVDDLLAGLVGLPRTSLPAELAGDR